MLIFEMILLKDDISQSRHLLYSFNLSYLRHNVNVVLDSGHVIPNTGSIHVNFTLDLFCIAVER